MKKGIKLFILVVMLLPLLIIKVNATSTNAYWHTEDESIVITASSKNNSTIYYEISGKTTILHLNNYNGPGLYLFFNTAKNEGQKFEINLEGTNIITSDKVGIDLREHNDDVKVEFTGNGTLTINAPTPISNDNRFQISGSSDTKENDNHDEEITTQEETQTNETKEEKVEKTEDTTNYKLLFIISAIAAVLLLGVTIFLIILLKKKK